MTKRNQLLSAPRVIAAMAALEKAVQAEIEKTMGEMKVLVIAVKSTQVTGVAISGCTCVACMMDVIGAIGSASGAEVETSVNQDAQTAQVH